MVPCRNFKVTLLYAGIFLGQVNIVVRPVLPDELLVQSNNAGNSETRAVQLLCTCVEACATDMHKQVALLYSKVLL